MPPCSEVEVMARTPDSAMKRTWLVEGKPANRCAAIVAGELLPGALYHLQAASVCFDRTHSEQQRQLVPHKGGVKTHEDALPHVPLSRGGPQVCDV